jgi:SAM-dependent methyltransferase
MIKDHYEMIRKNKIAFWWFNGRRDLFEAILKKKIKELVDFGVDLGCGPMTNEILYDDFAKNWISLDYSIESFKKVEDGKCSLKIIGDLLQTTLKDSSVDLIFLFDVLEYIENEDEALKEICRILKNSGLILISVPAFKLLWSHHDNQAGHKKRYRKKGILEFAKRNNLEVEFLAYYNSSFFIPIFIIRRILRLLPQGDKKLEIELSPRVFDNIFYPILIIENFINLKLFRIPFGTSVVAPLRKR